LEGSISFIVEVINNEEFDEIAMLSQIVGVHAYQGLLLIPFGSTFFNELIKVLPGDSIGIAEFHSRELFCPDVVADSIFFQAQFFGDLLYRKKLSCHTYEPRFLAIINATQFNVKLP